MARRTKDLVVVGASAGGVEALRAFVSGLPPDLPAAVLVVLHIPASGHSALPEILDRAGPLPTVAAENRMELRHGTVYVAPPDRHLLVTEERALLSPGPAENGHRPAIDALFRSAANERGAGVIGVVLSGSLDDGTAGITTIKAHDGYAIAQDPDEALYAEMPTNAIVGGPVDEVLKVAEMGGVLRKWSSEAVETAGERQLSAAQRIEERAARGEVFRADGNTEIAEQFEPSAFSCPDCSGVLHTIEPAQRYRCRVGHAWTAQALLQQRDGEVERALWAGLRALEEKRDLTSRMERDAEARGHAAVSSRYGDKREEINHSLTVLRGALFGDSKPAAQPD